MDDTDLVAELGDWLKPITGMGGGCGVDLGSAHDPLFTKIGAAIDNVTEQSEWRDIAKEIASLMKQTKDINVLAWNARASLYTEKYPAKGLAKNLFLLRYWVENYWDGIYPPIDQEFPEDAYLDRINAIANLGAPSWKSIALPLKKKVTSLSLGTGSYTLDNLVVFKQGGSVEGLQAPVGLLPNEESEYDELVSWFATALEQAVAIKSLLGKKTGEAFVEFDGHLIPTLQMGATLREAKTGSVSAGVSGGMVGTAAQPLVGSAPSHGVSIMGSRDDVIKAIDLICEYYQQHEPSSPVPLLLIRARKLVKKDFRDILSELRLGSSGDIEHLFGRAD